MIELALLVPENEACLEYFLLLSKVAVLQTNIGKLRRPADLHQFVVQDLILVVYLLLQVLGLHALRWRRDGRTGCNRHILHCSLIRRGLILPLLLQIL